MAGRPHGPCYLHTPCRAISPPSPRSPAVAPFALPVAWYPPRASAPGAIMQVLVWWNVVPAVARTWFSRSSSEIARGLAYCPQRIAASPPNRISGVAHAVPPVASPDPVKQWVADPGFPAGRGLPPACSREIGEPSRHSSPGCPRGTDTAHPATPAAIDDPATANGPVGTHPHLAGRTPLPITARLGSSHQGYRSRWRPYFRNRLPRCANTSIRIA